MNMLCTALIIQAFVLSNFVLALHLSLSHISPLTLSFLTHSLLSLPLSLFLTSLLSSLSHLPFVSFHSHHVILLFLTPSHHSLILPPIPPFNQDK